MSCLLQDRVVVVTGAGAGIGLGILQAALAAGARATGLDVAPEVEERVTAAGAAFIRADVADAAALSSAIHSVREREGRLDGLVSNAGITMAAPFLELGLDDMERIWRVNQLSVLIGCQAAARIMVADGRPGALVNIASVHAFASDQGYEAYAGSKGAIVAMARAMAWSLGPHGIRVNTLCPGLTLTETVSALIDRSGAEGRQRGCHATGEISSVAEIGHAAVYLLSDLSAALTGSELVADRGMSARLAAAHLEAGGSKND